MNLYVNHGRTFTPFRLRSEAASRERCSMGGEPPIGVSPSRVEAETRYLATLGLEEDLDVSLFCTFDYQSRQSPYNFFRATYKLHGQSQAPIQFVVHPRNSRRDSSSTL